MLGKPKVFQKAKKGEGGINVQTALPSSRFSLTGRAFGESYGMPEDDTGYLGKEFGKRPAPLNPARGYF